MRQAELGDASPLPRCPGRLTRDGRRGRISLEDGDVMTVLGEEHGGRQAGHARPENENVRHLANLSSGELAYKAAPPPVLQKPARGVSGGACSGVGADRQPAGSPPTVHWSSWSSSSAKDAGIGTPHSPREGPQEVPQHRRAVGVALPGLLPRAKPAPLQHCKDGAPTTQLTSAFRKIATSAPE